MCLRGAPQLPTESGAWLNDFTRVCREKGFTLDKYIEKLKNNGNGAHLRQTPMGGDHDREQPIQRVVGFRDAARRS